MKFLIRFSPATGWLCKAENITCDFCKETILAHTPAWHLSAPNCFACNQCYESKRKAGILWGVGQATPVTIVKEMPEELQDEDPKKEW